MTVWVGVQMLAAASSLMVGALAISRGPTNRLALPVTLLLVVTLTVFSLGAVALVRVSATRSGRSRERLERHAMLGQVWEQIVHDFVSPLSAARGAAELLGAQMKRTQQPEQQELAELIEQQLGRLNAVIGRYQKLSRFELSLQQVDLNALVKRVVLAHGGEVRLSSREGKGTLVELYLPMTGPAGSPSPG